MGNSTSSPTLLNPTPISITISVENNKFLNNLIKIDNNNNEKGILSPTLSSSSLSSTTSSNIVVVNKKKSNNHNNSNKPFSFKKIKILKKQKKLKNQKNQKNQNKEIISSSSSSSNIEINDHNRVSINKLLPEYLILKIIKLSCDIVFPSKTFMNISIVCRLWFKLSVKCIKHLYYQHKYIYESDKEMNYCRIIGRWLCKSNHYSTINRIQAIYLVIGIDQLGFSFLVPYLIKCPTLRLLRIEFTNGFNSKPSLSTSENSISDGRINTICQILQLNKHIRVLNLSNNIINSKSIQTLSISLFESKSTCSSIKEFIFRKSKLCSLKFSTLLESIVKLNKVTIINFSNNEIENDNLDSITHSLSNSKSLHTINLSKNYLNSTSIHLIIQACITNRITKNLDLRFNNFDLISDRESFFIQYSSKFDKLLI